MKKNIVVATLFAALLAGCSEELLDFRNAEISNGMVYSDGANEPFTGNVTNVPLRVIPTSDLSNMLKVSVRASKDQTLSNFFMVGSIASLIGNSDSIPVLCDVKVNEGYINDTAHCFTSSGRHKVMDVDYSEGNIDGDVTLYSLKDELESKLAEATFNNGKMEGELRVYGLKSGELVSRTTWENGVANGREEIYSDDTQELIWEATIVDGKYDGEIKQYDPHTGDLLKIRTFDHGVEIEQATAAGGQDCVDAWVTAYRQDVGEEQIITNDQISEWEQWCDEGRTPNA